jgi:hypothetical protein
MDKIIELTSKRIEEITETNIYKYIDKIIKLLINEQTISKINLSCVANKQIKLSHRKLFFYDILQQINIKINSILIISPSFWFSKMDVMEKTDFIFAYELFLCSTLSFVNLIYDKETELDKFKNETKFDFIYAELLREKTEFGLKIYLDDVIKTIKLAFNNLNIDGNILILTSGLTFEAFEFLNDLINKNIFVSCSFEFSKNISVLSYKSSAYFVLLKNYTGKKYKFTDMLQNDELFTNETLEAYNKNLNNEFEKMYYEMYNLNETQLEKYMYDNILDYCNNIQIFLSSKYVFNKKIAVWDSLVITGSTILYNVDDDINMFFTYIKSIMLNKSMSLKDSQEIIYINNNAKLQIDKKIKQTKFITDKKDIKKISFDIIYISNIFIINTVKNIFLDILYFYERLNKEGFILFDNINEININYKTAYDIFYKIFNTEIQILYDDFSQIICKKIL